MALLTPRQAEILQFIQDHIESTGYPPTRVEISRKLGFRSANAAEEHLRTLMRKGVIEILPGTSRGIRLLKETRGLPVVGRVAAGSPILAEEHIERHYPVDPKLFTPVANYFLRVYGMSMLNAGILEGDLLAVHRTTEVQNGQIVVARINNEVTVKRFQRQGDQVSLLPENSDFTPILVNLNREELIIEGLGVGIVRIGTSL